MLHGSATVRSQHAGAVGVIHQQQGVEPLTQTAQLLQRRQVSVHAEHRIRHHQLVAPARVFFHEAFEGIHPPVRVDPKDGPAQAAGIDDARVVQGVAVDEVLTTRKNGNHP